MSDVAKAWEAYFNDVAVERLEDYQADGWKTAEEIAACMTVPLVIARQRCDRDGNLDRKKIKCIYKGGLRALTIYRPKL